MAGNDLHDGSELFLALQNYCYECVYSDMRFVKLNDVLSYTFTMFSGQHSLILWTSVVKTRLRYSQ